MFNAEEFKMIRKIVNEEIYNLLNPEVEIVTTKGVPVPASSYSAGYDLKADLSNINPKFFNNAFLQEGKLYIRPGGHCLVPTGIFTAFPGIYRVEIVPRSGLALKLRITITNSPGTIEGDYKDEWGVIIDNEGSDTFIINDGDRICQAIFSLIVRPKFVVKSHVDELSGPNRGGGYGHTGTSGSGVQTETV